MYLNNGAKVIGLYAPRNGYNGPIVWRLDSECSDDYVFLLHAGYSTFRLKSLSNHVLIDNNMVVETMKLYHNMACMSAHCMEFCICDLDDYQSPSFTGLLMKQAKGEL